jgi:hypothetical protein
MIGHPLRPGSPRTPARAPKVKRPPVKPEALAGVGERALMAERRTDTNSRGLDSPGRFLGRQSRLTGARLPAALRRSWRLIHGHGPRLLLELTKAYAALVGVAVIPLFIASDPGLAYPLRVRLLPIVLGIGYGPFAALALTLAYYRLAAARDAAALNLAPQSGG